MWWCCRNGGVGDTADRRFHCIDLLLLRSHKDQSWINIEVAYSAAHLFWGRFLVRILACWKAIGLGVCVFYATAIARCVHLVKPWIKVVSRVFQHQERRLPPSSLDKVETALSVGASGVEGWHSLKLLSDVGKDLRRRSLRLPGYYLMAFDRCGTKYFARWKVDRLSWSRRKL